MKKLDLIKKNFDENGYVKINKILSNSEVSKILNEINNIKNKFLNIKNPNLHFTKDKKINTIHDINKFIRSKILEKFSKNKKLVKIIEHILEKKTFVRNMEFFLKPKKTGKKSPIHQDNYYWNIKNKKALNVWLACTESNKNNGGVFYFKKSHKKGILEHELSFQAGSSQQIPDRIVKKMRYKKFFPNLRPGDCIIHHCEVAHGSNKNISNLDRVGLVISYKAKGAKVDKEGWHRYQKNLKKNLNFLKKSL
jgi:phytanoyl-CoA hydroxylase